MAIGIGETLRTARTAQNRTLSDASAATCVRAGHLADLEEERFGRMGGDVYVKGFLRAYARYLGLDPEPLVQRFVQAHPDEDEAVMSPPQRPLVRVGPRSGLAPRGLGGLLVVGALVVVVSVVAGLLGADDRPPQAAQASGPAPASPQRSADSGGQGGKQPAASRMDRKDAGAKGVRVALAVRGAPSWMRVTVDGRQVVEGLRRNGWHRTFAGKRKVALRLGDAGRVAVRVNGRRQRDVGGAGEVVDLVYRAHGRA